MAVSGSKKVVYAALAGNSLIALIKFIAAGISGSVAMLSEGVHSAVDTGNQILLLYGMRQASKPADEAHPFGYGRELYFWAFIVALLLFSLGAGVSFYQGIEKLLNPHRIESFLINYIVLALAMVFEACAWWVAFNEFRKTKGAQGFLEEVRRSKDPTVFTVLFEDTAALLGLFSAFIGILMVQLLGWEFMDGVASIVIGCILTGTAIMLSYECKGLLIGESASPELVEGVRTIVAETSTVYAVNELRSTHLGPNDVLLAISLDFQDGITSGAVEETIYQLEQTIKNRFPQVKRLFIEAQSTWRHRDALMADMAREQAAANGENEK